MVTFSHHRTRLHRHTATNWQLHTGTKYILQTGSRFKVTTPTIQNNEIYIKRNTRQEMPSQQNPSYMHYNVDHTNKTEDCKHQRYPVATRTYLMPTTWQTAIQQKATTKFIVVLQPLTTKQRLSSTLGNQRTHVYVASGIKEVICLSLGPHA